MAASEFKCTVRNFEQLTPSVFALAFETDRPLEFRGGQFISVVVPAGAASGGRDLRRAYSIASAPEQRPIELCVKFIEEGPGSGYLATLRPGDVFRGFAPYGDFVYQTPSLRNACFIATGTGIAPFRSMVLSREYLDSPPAQAWCFLGVRTQNELLYVRELSGVKGLTFFPSITQASKDWQGFRGRVTEYFRSLDGEFPWGETDFYLCGNGPMITEMKELLLERGVDKKSIHQEIYYR
ncbi:MAG: hypothetical protein A2X94_10700 [Bdellovibrionales bacterium GWB1_55_8]|nr:MAG: hypothetical protein A2X94_10700 [Bdellovibrionales bacterium GWB1_55_8]